MTPGDKLIPEGFLHGMPPWLAWRDGFEPLLEYALRMRQLRRAGPSNLELALAPAFQRFLESLLHLISATKLTVVPEFARPGAGRPDTALKRAGNSERRFKAIPTPELASHCGFGFLPGWRNAAGRFLLCRELNSGSADSLTACGEPHSSGMPTMCFAAVAGEESIQGSRPSAQPHLHHLELRRGSRGGPSAAARQVPAT